MSYSVSSLQDFKREFKKLDRYTQRIIKSWIDDNLIGLSKSKTAWQRIDRKSERANGGIVSEITD